MWAKFAFCGGFRTFTIAIEPLASGLQWRLAPGMVEIGMVKLFSNAMH